MDDPARPAAAPSAAVRRADLVYGALGVALALAWAHHVAGVGLEYRTGGDVGYYLLIARSFGSVRDVLLFSGWRPVGMPALIWMVGKVVPGAIVQGVSAVLLAAHLVAAPAFFFALRKPLEEAVGVRLHGVWLLALLAWPPLVGGTTLPLSDTLAADLLMLAIAARVTGRGWAAGAALGAMVLVRMPTLPIALGLVAAELVCRAPSTAAVGLAIALVWQGATCAYRYGGPCLTSPAETGRTMRVSLTVGPTSARQYWSPLHGPRPLGMTVVPDAFLEAHLPPICRTAMLADRLACFATHPLLGMAIAAKKAVGLCDAFYFQPGAVDLTPRWARLLSRPFGAVAAAGIAVAVGWLVVAICRRALPLFLVALPPLLVVAAQAPFHVEPRYGFPAVPGAVVAAALTVQRRRLVPIVILALVAGLFLWQTHLWDLADPVLPKIEGW